MKIDFYGPIGSNRFSILERKGETMGNTKGNTKSDSKVNAKAKVCVAEQFILACKAGEDLSSFAVRCGLSGFATVQDPATGKNRPEYNSAKDLEKAVRAALLSKRIVRNEDGSVKETLPPLFTEETLPKLARKRKTSTESSRVTITIDTEEAQRILKAMAK